MKITLCFVIVNRDTSDILDQSEIRIFIKSLKKKKFHIFGGKGAGGFGMSRQQF